MLSEVLEENEDFRFDAEFFDKFSIRIINYKNYKKLEEISNTHELHSNGAFKDIFNILHDSESKTVRYIRSENVGNFFIEGDLEYISKKAHSKLKKTRTIKNDIITARTGKVGGASIITEDWVDSNSNQNVVNIRIKDNSINPFYLLTYLNIRHGIKQFKRSSTGNVQPWLNLSLLRKIKIPLLPHPFQTHIAELVQTAHVKLEESKKIYAEAEQILLGELGIGQTPRQPAVATPQTHPFRMNSQGNPKEGNLNISVKSFNESFGVSGRLDAEYYQPKYDEILKKVRNYESGFTELKNLKSYYSTGYPFKSDEYLESGIPLVRINNIKDGKLDLLNAAYLSEQSLETSPKDIGLENDILISMSGSIGNSCRIPEGIKCLINQRILKFTVKDFNVFVLPLIINSIIGKMQLERIGTGGVQTNISASDIFKIQIPLLPQQTQTQIAQKIQDNFRLRAESQELLERAKREVEKKVEGN